MKDPAPALVRLEDYRAPEWRVESIQLDFVLDPELTRVTSVLVMRRVAPESPGPGMPAPLRLFGSGFERYRLQIDGQLPAPGQVQEDARGLLVSDLPETACLTVETWLCPRSNTALEGLFVSSDCLCTQCEPEGFRRITFFPDRPDVLTRYRVRLEAEKARFPVLLSNGNRVEAGDLPEGRHFAVWEDPFPKPCYLFALVAGDLVCRSDDFRTASGRNVRLEVYVQAHQADRCAHALASLARAMRYDEDAFGREYDLDVYMLVAVDDFNMGAMENKGLNLFNAKYVLASPDTATDDDYVAIESIIAHEYFHNWSGNRVTCRDWFQLSLKEGLTVFRDQEFTTDCTLKAVKRIDDVQRLRAFQFPEDAGPLAHPVRPDRYQEINNFYTMTVYEKGAELIRMLRTLIGREVFRSGLDRYFDRFDGQAVTVEDFLSVMEEASGRDLGDFMHWYRQAGTPAVTARADFDEKTRRLRISLSQTTPATPGQAAKRPVPIPLRVAVFAADGRSLSLGDGRGGRSREVLLELKEARQEFRLDDLDERPAAISWLRGFSAPVHLDADPSLTELLLLLECEQDGFTRWDCAQGLWRRIILARLTGAAEAELEGRFAAVLARLIADSGIEPVLLATLLQPPPHRELMAALDQGDPVGLAAAIREAERATFAAILPALELRLETLEGLDDVSFDAARMGMRRLGRRLLELLVIADPGRGIALASAQYRAAGSQTQRMGALFALNECDDPVRDELLADFEARFHNEPLVLDKWFSLQASCQQGQSLQRVGALLQHPGFRWTNPNRVRAVLGPFMAQNHSGFHRSDGEGYRQAMRWLEHLERINPQTAARLVQPFAQWRRLDPARSAEMHAALEPVLERPDLSNDFRDVLSRMLAPAAGDREGPP